MKAVILNGFKSGGISGDFYQSLIKGVKSSGFEVNTVELARLELGNCRGCFACWVKNPGICIINDDGREVAGRVIQADVLIFFTPVTFGGYSSDLKKAVDRLIPLISPFFKQLKGEVHHKKRYPKYPHLIGIGVMDKPDSESVEIFKRLITRNALNLYSPTSAGEVFAAAEGEEQISGRVKEILAGIGVAKC